MILLLFHGLSASRGGFVLSGKQDGARSFDTNIRLKTRADAHRKIRSKSFSLWILIRSFIGDSYAFPGAALCLPGIVFCGLCLFFGLLGLGLIVGLAVTLLAVFGHPADFLLGFLICHCLSPLSRLCGMNGQSDKRAVPAPVFFSRSRPIPMRLFHTFGALGPAELSRTVYKTE